jgi:hypothetical protein
MRRTIVVLFAVGLLFHSVGVPQASAKPLVLVHYMPWYQTPSIHGYWGWHWTMNHYSPDKFYPSGNRQIASQYYPLTGPYDSDDKNILEYQTLLMKIAGIDGVLADWYGMDSYNDYGVINESTKKLFAAVQKSKLSFGIVYEDQTVKNMVAAGKVSAAGALDYGKTVMRYLQDTWFSTSEYVQVNNRPLLMVFGPQYYKLPSDWTAMFSGLRVAPSFYTEDNTLGSVTAGAYPWPPMGRSIGGILSMSSLNAYLDQFYTNAASWPNVVTSAFPGFHDIYKDAGVGASYGYLDAGNGDTFRSTLKAAIDHTPDVIQIVTWNDYGEGTMIEPTVEYGTQYLEIVQAARIARDVTFPFATADLLLPMRLYKARVQYSGNASVNSQLDAVADMIVAQQPGGALALLDSLAKTTDVKHDNSYLPRTCELEQNFPNPFNPSTVIRYSIVNGSTVRLTIFDVLGRNIATLVDEYQTSGTYAVRFDGSALNSGVYYYRLEAGEYHAVKKFLLMK